jgi:hypothetical protein
VTMRSGRRRAMDPPGMTRLGMLVGLLVLVGGIYLGAKFIPPYWAYVSMLDPVKEAAMAAAARGGNEERVRTGLIAKAKEFGFELTEENVEIVRDGNFVVVRVAWEAPVVLPRYRHTLRFHVESQAPAL